MPAASWASGGSTTRPRTAPASGGAGADDRLAGSAGPCRRCPRARRCEACGATGQLELATYQTPVGVFCAIVCGPCIDAAKAPPVRSWVGAVERVAAHCGHLGIDVDQMAALLHPDHHQQEGSW